MDDELILRGELEGLRWNVADIAVTLKSIEELLKDGEEEEGDEG